SSGYFDGRGTRTSFPRPTVWFQGVRSAGGTSDHHRFCTLRLPEGVDVPPDDQAALAGNLLEWAAAAGLDTTAEHISDALGTTTNDTAVYALVEALGLEPLEAVEPLFDFDELDWWDAYRRGENASMRVCREWTSRRGNLPAYDQPLPGAAEFVRFLDLVAASRFGGGLTRAQLQAEAQRLVDAYPEP
ncbi:hypothetical protein, partial [Dactylosporangium sp. NPDC005555]|uniref:hypothetical protein n=1 Tax=Dactylosporangium sp. NPDC005555 TaxID=3154889 RepID=UPI0033B8615A